MVGAGATFDGRGRKLMTSSATRVEVPLAVILAPASGEDLMLNWWNWRPLVAMLVRAGILPEGEREERCLASFCGGRLSAQEALRAAYYIEALLPTLEPDERVLLDGARTQEPINYHTPISELSHQEIWVSYSVKREVLAKFAEFCRRSGGFEVS
jgi:hypothetical protein